MEICARRHPGRGLRLKQLDEKHKELLRSHGKLDLRPANEDDCHLLWIWRNDPDVRTASFTSTAIQWEEHVIWLRQNIKDTDCLIFLVINRQGCPIGQVRFDKETSDSAEVTVSIDARERYKGYGSSALEHACKYVAQEHGIDRVVAHIKEWNKASIDAFSRAGFTELGLVDFKGQKAIEMFWALSKGPDS